MLYQKEKKVEYNKIIQELEQIIAELENGGCGLERAAMLYERGTELAKMLGKQLEETKGKITVIKKQLDKITEEDFN